MIKNQKQFFAGMAFLFVVVVLILSVFSRMSVTNNIEKYLMDTEDTRYGWSYEIMTDEGVTAVEPEFLDKYTMVLPGGEDAKAVKITRTFTETLPEASLEWTSYNSAVEVLIEGELIYSDFQTKERNEAGFLLLWQEEIDQIRPEKTVKISLPWKYTGMELTMITYFGEGAEGASPVYPFVKNDQTEYAMYVTDSVQPVAIMTLCAVFAVVITVIFILDIANEKTNYRILLLSLYFIMLFLSKACNSLPGTSSVLADGKDLLFLNELYVAPLYLYLALDLTGRKKYLLTAGVILWFLYEGTRVFLNIKGGMMSLANRKGLGALLLFIAVAAAFLLEYICGRAKKRKKEAYHISYGILTVVVSVFCVLYGAKEWEGDVGQYLFQVVYTVAHKNGFVAVYLFTNICAVMASIVLILEFIRRTIKTKEMLTVLEERSSLTLEGYNRVLKSEEATNSVRHEMLHHMTALMGIVRNGETERACEYISSVTDQILHLPAVRYSQNILVNVVAGTYLDKAKSQGIQVEYNLQVPVELKIADEDLCVFLTNMLQNALQACERMDREQERYIRVKMYLNENFLFIGCVNSWSGDQDSSGDLADEKRGARRRHGFGLEAMSRIAEKYGSILKIDKSPREFSVKSNLCLRQWRD